MTILAVSDIESAYLGSSRLKERFPRVNLIISCGDLPFDYLESIADRLNAPLYYVSGNHQTSLMSGRGRRNAPTGGINLHDRAYSDPGGILLAGFQGSLRYNYGPNQYSQFEMWLQVMQVIPHLWMNRVRCGRYLDVLVTHAPGWQIQDREDLPHQGFKAFRWLLKTFKPRLHLHGHVHIVRSSEPVQTVFQQTLVVNTCGWRELELRNDVEIPRKREQPAVIRKGFL